ncbi:MAG: hypothetical protein QHG99_06680 [Methanomicrobiales archaeon]|nr:hypothetical protein [Methanomicrobiales archaeon]
MGQKNLDEPSGMVAYQNWNERPVTVDGEHLDIMQADGTLLMVGG